MSAGAHTQAYSLAALVSIVGVLLFARPGARIISRWPHSALSSSTPPCG